MDPAAQLIHDLLVPQRCCLLVVDKQGWYLDPRFSPFLRDAASDLLHQARAEVAGMDDFIAQARHHGVPVAWTLMEEGPPAGPANVENRWRRRPEEPRLLRGDPGHAVVGNERPRREDIVVHKVYPDGFAGGRLGHRLRDLGCTTLVLIGGYAARCVLATAFGAQGLGYDVVVPRDLVTPHPQHAAEERIFEQVIDSVVGFVLEPAQIVRYWEA